MRFKEFSIKEDFKRILIEIFQSNIEDIDFIDSNAAAYSINSWVEKITKKQNQESYRTIHD